MTRPLTLLALAGVLALAAPRPAAAAEIMPHQFRLPLGRLQAGAADLLRAVPDAARNAMALSPLNAGQLAARLGLPLPVPRPVGR